MANSKQHQIREKGVANESLSGWPLEHLWELSKNASWEEEMGPKIVGNLSNQVPISLFSGVSTCNLLQLVFLTLRCATFHTLFRLLCPIWIPGGIPGKKL